MYTIWDGFGKYNGRILHITHVNQKTPLNKNTAETIGKNTPAGIDEMERKKHSDTEEVEQSGRAVDWKGNT